MARKTSGMAERQWRERLGRWRKSGLNVAEFCGRESVSPASFYVWRRKLQHGETPHCAANVPLLLPVQVVDQAASVPTSTARDAVGQAAASVIEVTLPHGVTIRVGAETDAARLQSVLRAVVAETGGC